jgi:hypothetical protein
MTAPERYRTLAEVCELYFPGVSTCVLRWMIKRRGYAHSRWGREYRLTDSQVAAIQADLARPARPGSGGTAATSTIRGGASRAQTSGQTSAGGAVTSRASRRRMAGSSESWEAMSAILPQVMGWRPDRWCRSSGAGLPRLDYEASGPVAPPPPWGRVE